MRQRQNLGGINNPSDWQKSEIYRRFIASDLVKTGGDKFITEFARFRADMARLDPKKHDRRSADVSDMWYDAQGLLNEIIKTIGDIKTLNAFEQILTPDFKKSLQEPDANQPTQKPDSLGQAFPTSQGEAGSPHLLQKPRTPILSKVSPTSQSVAKKVDVRPPLELSTVLIGMHATTIKSLAAFLDMVPVSTELQEARVSAAASSQADPASPSSVKKSDSQTLTNPYSQLGSLLKCRNPEVEKEVKRHVEEHPDFLRDARFVDTILSSTAMYYSDDFVTWSLGSLTQNAVVPSPQIRPPLIEIMKQQGFSHIKRDTLSLYLDRLTLAKFCAFDGENNANENKTDPRRINAYRDCFLTGNKTREIMSAFTLSYAIARLKNGDNLLCKMILENAKDCLSLKNFDREDQFDFLFWARQYPELDKIIRDAISTHKIVAPEDGRDPVELRFPCELNPRSTAVFLMKCALDSHSNTLILQRINQIFAGKNDTNLATEDRKNIAEIMDYAVDHALPENIKLLLDRLPKSEVFCDGNLLRRAINKGLIRVVKILTEHGAHLQPTAPDAESPKESHLMQLVQKGSLTAMRSFLDTAEKRPNFNLNAFVNQKDQDGISALHNAAKYGREAITKLLIEYGADVMAKNNNGETPLDVAAAIGAENTLSILREQVPHHIATPRVPTAQPIPQNANLNNLLLETCRGASLRNLTGVISAAKARITDAAEFSKFINQKFPPENKTALHYAAENAREHMTLLLLEKGADLSQQDASGNTPLHLAAEIGAVKTTLILLKVASPEVLKIRNSAGENFVGHVLRYGDTTVLQGIIMERLFDSMLIAEVENSFERDLRDLVNPKEGPNSVQRAFAFGQDDVIKFMIDNKLITPEIINLGQLIECGYSETLELLKRKNFIPSRSTLPDAAYDARCASLIHEWDPFMHESRSLIFDFARLAELRENYPLLYAATIEHLQGHLGRFSRVSVPLFLKNFPAANITAMTQKIASLQQGLGAEGGVNPRNANEVVASYEKICATVSRMEKILKDGKVPIVFPENASLEDCLLRLEASPSQPPQSSTSRVGSANNNSSSQSPVVQRIVTTATPGRHKTASTPVVPTTLSGTVMPSFGSFVADSSSTAESPTAPGASPVPTSKKPKSPLRGSLSGLFHGGDGTDLGGSSSSGASPNK